MVEWVCKCWFVSAVVVNNEHALLTLRLRTVTPVVTLTSVFLYRTPRRYFASSGGSSGFLSLRLRKVRAHITLEVKVGKLIGFAKLKKLAELRVGEDATSILRILKIMCTDIP